MNSVTKKKKKKKSPLTTQHLLKNLIKITPFGAIKSVKQEPLAISNTRTNVILHENGQVGVPSDDKYTSNIYSFEITPDIHKVVISNVNAKTSTLSKKPTYIIAGISVKDIPNPGKPNGLKEELLAELLKLGYSKNSAQKELEAVETKIQECVDPFIDSNTLFKQSALHISDLVNSKGSIEFIIPPGTFLGRNEKKVYLFVSSTTEPTVTPYTFPQDKPYFYLEPAAEALTVGDKLSNSRIMLGEVHLGQETIAGTYLWKKPATKIKSNGEDFQIQQALFLPLRQPKFLKPAIAFLQDELAKKNPGTIASILDKMFKKIKFPLLKLCIYEADIKVPVYVKDNKQFFSFVWRTNDLVKDEFIEKKLSQPRKHQTFQSLYDNFSIGQIYNNITSFTTTTTAYAADQFVRGLLAQPKGKKSISIDGMVLPLFGGAIYEAFKCTYIHGSSKDAGTDGTGFESKDKRLTQDYLYSMVYSGAADQSQKDHFSGEGFLFFDSPIHYNHPKVVPGREFDSQFIAALKAKGKNSLVMYLIALRQRAKRAKMYFSDWLNIGDPDDKQDKRPTSGCHALQALLKDIFTEVNRYKVGIDYVYSDLEGIYNTGWFIRTHNRIEHSFEKKTEAPNLFNISLNQTNGVINNQKMWNAVCESERFQKEIRPKLESRGFHPYNESNDSDDFYLSMVNQSFWRPAATERPNFGYWLASNFAMRREINIWDCVMTEYTAEIQQKFVMDIFTKINSKVKYCTYTHSAAKGHSHYGTYGLYLESSLGGSIQLPKTMSSCHSLYGGSSCEGHCKFNLDDYRCFVEDQSAFSLFKDEVNHIRAGKSNNPNGIMPFYSCQYYKKVYYPNQDQDIFYKDVLFHTWMCQPDQMIAYFNYDSKIKDAFEKEDSKDHKKDYFRQCYLDTQKILDELNSTITEPIVNTLDTRLINECDPFVMTGVETKTKQIWRLTFKAPKETDYEKDKGSNSLCVFNDDVSITFPKGEIIKKDATGYWIKNPKKKKPEIKFKNDFFKTMPAYYVEKPFDKETPTFKAFSSKYSHCKYIFWHAQGTTIFGESAPNQIWEAKIKFDTLTPYSRIFKMDVSKLEGIQTGIWYTFIAKVRAPKPSCIYGSPTNTDDGLVHVELTYQGNGETRTIGYKFTPESPYKPFTYLELGQSTSDKEPTGVHCEYFKILVDGKNIRADIFRESNGMNISRVNKSISEFKDYKFKNTPCTDPLEVKVSWLNTENSAETYTVWVKTVTNMIGDFSSESKLATIEANPNSQGYEVYPLKLKKMGVKSIGIIIKDRKDNIVFNMTSIVDSLIRL